MRPYSHDLTVKHLEAGKSQQDIAEWLDVPMDFIKNIAELIARNLKYKAEKAPRLQLPGRKPRLRYKDSGRGGTIWFENNDSSFDMWWEFAGGDALVIVDIPTEQQWVLRTKLPLEQRADILTFIGEQIVADKISGNGSFIIGDDVLTFYRG